MSPTFERAGDVAHPLLRVLAPIDAFLLPGAALCWVMSWPGRGELVGAFVGVLCLWRGIKRASSAVNDFDGYRWTTLRFAKLAITTWVVMALFKLVWLIQG